MKQAAYHVRLSPLDKTRFGVTTVRADHFTRSRLSRLLAFCRRHRARFCIVRCATQDAAGLRTLKAQGFKRMETLVYFAAAVRGKRSPMAFPDAVRFLKPGEAPAVRRIARDAFQNHPSHYLNDPRIPKRLSRETYADWGYREARRHGRDRRVLVAERRGRLTGFLSMRLSPPHEAEGVLWAVAPRSQRQGQGPMLIQAGLALSADRKCRRMIISTPATNRRAQAVWRRLGFHPIRSLDTFHKWFPA